MQKRPYLVVHPSWMVSLSTLFTAAPTRMNFLLLFDHVEKIPELTAEFVNTVRKDDSALTVILDNGVWENQSVPSSHQLVNVAALAGVDYIVAPDILKGSAKDNIELAREFVTYLRDRQLKAKKPKALVMVQGQNSNDILTHWTSGVIRELAFLGVDMFGIPRHIADSGESRAPLVRRVHAAAPNVGIHLMGMSRNPHDDKVSYQAAGVTGIDSAKPLWMSPGEFEMYLAGYGYGSRPKKFFSELLASQDLNCVSCNIKRYYRFLKVEVAL